jgi:hypothetical protein
MESDRWGLPRFPNVIVSCCSSPTSLFVFLARLGSHKESIILEKPGVVRRRSAGSRPEEWRTCGALLLICRLGNIVSFFGFGVLSRIYK